jgi:hypothetical protein
MRVPLKRTLCEIPVLCLHLPKLKTETLVSQTL